MGTNQLVLSLNEPLDRQTLNLADLVLMTDSESLASTIAVSLSTTTTEQVCGSGDASTGCVTISLNSLLVQLSPMDANRIKSQPPLCTQSSLCYLTHTEDLGFDMSTFIDNEEDGEDEVEVKNAPLGSAPFSGQFSADGYPPYVIDFSINMALGVVDLTFSEPVNHLGIDARYVYLPPPRASFRPSRPRPSLSH